MKFRYGSDSNSHLGGNIVSDPNEQNKNGDPATYITPIWDLLIKEFSIKSVFDVGCGAGYALEYFKSKQLNVLGLDGLYENVYDTLKKNIPCVYQDLQKGTCRVAGFDLVNCLEVAEHIEEEHVVNLLDCFRGNKYICMTAALPGQGGHHHVNCKPNEYWIDLLDKANFEFLSELSYKCRELHDGHFRNSGMIFRSKILT